MSENTPVTATSGLAQSLLPGVLRTAVPIIYGMLVHKGVVSWLGVDGALVENLITLLVTAGVYAGIRVLETHRAAFGWLLGYAKQPVYVKGEIVSVTDQPLVDGAVATVEHTEPNDDSGVPAPGQD